MKRPGARPDTWMPIYWGDYARDTGHLSATTHGAYLMLIKHYWCTGAPLPDDDAQLWRIACADSPSAWKKLRLIVGGFFTVADGVWKHKRIDAEMVRAKQLAEIRQEVGKRGGQASANKRATEPPKDTPNADQLVDQALNQTHQQTSTPSPSPSQPKEPIGSSGGTADAAPPAKPIVLPSEDEALDLPAMMDRSDEGAAVRAWNVMAAGVKGMAQVQSLNSQRRKRLKARLAECGGLDGWTVALEKIAASKFLTGGNDRGWIADFDFVLQQKSFTRLMEGSYDNRAGQNPLASVWDKLYADAAKADAA